MWYGIGIVLDIYPATKHEYFDKEEDWFKDYFEIKDESDLELADFILNNNLKSHFLYFPIDENESFSRKLERIVNSKKYITIEKYAHGMNLKFNGREGIDLSIRYIKKDNKVHAGITVLNNYNYYFSELNVEEAVNIMEQFPIPKEDNQIPKLKIHNSDIEVKLNFVEKENWNRQECVKLNEELTEKYKDGEEAKYNSSFKNFNIKFYPEKYKYGYRQD